MFASAQARRPTRSLSRPAHPATATARPPAVKVATLTWYAVALSSSSLLAVVSACLASERKKGASDDWIVSAKVIFTIREA